MCTKKSTNESIRVASKNVPTTIGSKMVSSAAYGMLSIVSITLNFYSFVDADGTGYVEDGREIFDDVESDEDDLPQKSKKRKSETEMGNKSKKRLRDVNKPVDGNASIRKMFGNVAATKTKKEAAGKLEDDDILAGILGEIGPDSESGVESSSVSSKPKTETTKANTSLNARTEMAIVKEYMQKFNKSSATKKSEPTKQSAKDDVK